MVRSPETSFMHEWALAQGVISTVLAMAKEREAREIVEVKIDRLQQIDIDIFSAALRELGGTPLEKDESEAIHFLPELAHTFIRCPQCGGPDFHERARDVDRTHKNFKVGAPDPRLATIHKWLKNVKRVTVAKGGVGKSLVATTFSLMLSKQWPTVGLLDLDFHGPSCYIILDAKGVTPMEEKGLIPLKVHEIKLMSVAYYAGEKPIPLRGPELFDTLKGILAITRWERTDFLIVDAPPGMDEEIFDVVHLTKNVEFLIVTTPNSLTLKTMGRLKLLLEMKALVLGTIENMRIIDTEIVKELAQKLGIRYLEHIHFDREVEKYIDNPENLSKTRFADEVKSILGVVCE